MSLGDGASQWGDPTQWFDALLDPFFSLLGPLFPLLIGLVIMSMLYVYSGSLALPTVVGILIGGFALQLMPAPAQTVGQIIIFAGILIGIYVAFTDRSAGGRI